MFKRRASIKDLAEWYNDYKKNLNEWIVVQKKYIFNLETNKKECFLRIAPVAYPVRDAIIDNYSITEELYNKIQELDIIKLIVEKEGNEENDKETEA